MSREINHTVKLLGFRIKEAREKAALSQAELALHIGIAKETLSKYENGHRIPDALQLNHMIKATGCDPEWLLTGVYPAQNRAYQSDDLPDGVVKIDIYALAGAGNPKDLITDDPIESIVLPSEFSGQNIVPVKVKGMSMFPTIWDGALVGVDRAERGVISGEIYAVWMPYEGAVIKRLFMEMDKVLIRSDNKEFPSFTIPYVELENGSHGDNFILGRVKWIIQRR